MNRWLFPMSNTTPNSPAGRSSFTTVLVHFALYIVVGAGLIAANTILAPASLWFHWPLLIWGAILAVHAWIAYRTDLRRTVETYATEQRILTEMQLEKHAADIAAALVPEEAPAEEPKKKPSRTRRKKPVKKPAKKIASKRGSASGKSAQTAKTPAKKKPARRTRAKRKPAASKG